MEILGRLSTQKFHTIGAPVAGSAAGLRHNRAFQHLLWGRTCQVTGGAMTALALMLFAVDLTGSGRWGSAVMAASGLGGLVASLPAGVMVDRWDRRRTMVATSLLMALVLAVVSVSGALGVAIPGELVVAAGLVGVLSCFFGPAEQATLQRIVPTADLPAAASLNQARSSVANLLGPSLAGLLSAIARWLPLLGDALLNLVAAGLVARIPRQPPVAGGADRRHPLSELREGLSFLLACPPLRAVLSLNAAASIGFGGMLALVTLSFTADGVPRAVIGGLQTACGLGGVCGALLAPRLLARWRIATLFIGAVLVNCLCGIGIALVPRPAVVIGLLCLACLVLPPGLAGIQAHQLTVPPDRLQGRVAAAMGFVGMVLAPMATLLAGLLVDKPWTLGLSPFLTAIVATGVIAVLSKDLRRLGRLEDVAA